MITALARFVACIIYETVYLTKLFVATMKRGVAIKIFVCYVLSVKWLVHQ
jgi:hypothetical protein